MGIKKKNNGLKLRYKIRLHIEVHFLMGKGRGVELGEQGMPIYHLFPHYSTSGFALAGNELHLCSGRRF